MTKRVNWVPNLRVDIPDMTAGTNILAPGVISQFVEQSILDDMPRAASGFRVEIANQVTAPGEITVYNGAAFNRDGQILQNEDEENASRSITFLADAQYFVEVFFTTNAAVVDARNFWDPTVDNGTDPSGDPRLPGREFPQNVATRLAPDWQIVNPVSTTGFQLTTDPNSTRVPVAVIQVVGGVVVNATTVPAQTTLEYDALLGATTIRVIDSRVFPDVFTATVGGAAVSVTSNDRRNGVLTLTVGLAAGHSAGERFVRTGVSLTQFLVDRDNPALPATQSQDARLRMFQGMEDRGKALATNPASSTAPADRSDAQIQDLKDYIDFIAAEVREIRFGAERGSDISITSPPTTFANPPRYYHRAGGVAGARTNSVSVGDGVNSFGDHNVTGYANAHDMFQAAFTFLNSVGGGTLFVKRGTYSLATAINPISPGLGTTMVRIVGEGVDLVELRSTGAVPALQLPNNAGACIEQLRLTVTGTAVAALSATTGANPTRLSMAHCRVQGLVALNNAVFAQSNFYDCDFTAATNLVAVQGDFIDTVFDNCRFTAGNGAGGRSVQILGNATGGPTRDVTFRNCRTVGGTTNAAAVELVTAGAANTATELKFAECVFTGTSGVSVLAGAVATVSKLSLVDCRSEGLPLCALDNVTDVLIDHCQVGFGTTTDPGIAFGTNAANARLRVRSCRVTQLSNSGTSRVGIAVGLAADLGISGCTTVDCDIGISIASINKGEITDCAVTNPTGTTGQVGILMGTSTTNVAIRGCVITDIKNLSGALVAAIRGTGLFNGLTIAECFINTVGTTAAAIPSYGIRLEPTAGTGNCLRLGIVHNVISIIAAGGAQTAVAIDVTDNVTEGRITGNAIDTIGVTALTTIGIRVAGGSTVDISRNTLFGLGLSSNTLVAGVYVTKGSLNAQNFTVAGNSMIISQSGAGVNELSGGVVFDDCGYHVVITANTVESLIDTLYGVRVRNTSVIQAADFVISNNQLGQLTDAALWAGVRVSLAGPGAGLQTSSERVVVAGNIIRGFDTLGVQVESTQDARGVTVNGNVIQTKFNGPVGGVSVSGLNRYAISGNSINLEDNNATSKVGILALTCTYGCISGNDVWIQHMSNTNAVIYISGGAGVNVSGNMLHLINAASTAAGIRGNGATNAYAAANIVQAPNGNLGWTGVNTLAQSNIASPSQGTNPAGFGDIDLNISFV